MERSSSLNTLKRALLLEHKMDLKYDSTTDDDVRIRIGKDLCLDIFEAAATSRLANLQKYSPNPLYTCAWSLDLTAARLVYQMYASKTYYLVTAIQQWKAWIGSHVALAAATFPFTLACLVQAQKKKNKPFKFDEALCYNSQTMAGRVNSLHSLGFGVKMNVIALVKQIDQAYKSHEQNVLNKKLICMISHPPIPKVDFLITSMNVCGFLDRLLGQTNDCTQYIMSDWNEDIKVIKDYTYKQMVTHLSI